MSAVSGADGGFSAVSAASGLSVAARRAAQREKARSALLNIDRDFGDAVGTGNAGMQPPARNPDSPIIAVDTSRRSRAAMVRRPPPAPGTGDATEPMPPPPKPAAEADAGPASPTSADPVPDAPPPAAVARRVPPPAAEQSSEAALLREKLGLVGPAVGTPQSGPMGPSGMDVAEMARLRRQLDQLRLDKQQLEEHNARYDGLVRDREEKLKRERHLRREERADARRMNLDYQGSAISAISEISAAQISPRGHSTRKARGVAADVSASEVGRLQERASRADDLQRRVNHLERQLDEQRMRQSQCQCAIA